MNQTSRPAKQPAEAVIVGIRRVTCRQSSFEEKSRVVLEGLRGGNSIAELCRREGTVASTYYGWPEDTLKAGIKRLSESNSRPTEYIRCLPGS